MMQQNNKNNYKSFHTPHQTLDVMKSRGLMSFKKQTLYTAKE